MFEHRHHIKLKKDTQDMHIPLAHWGHLSPLFICFSKDFW